MASVTGGVWAIDIGSNALKALRLRQGEEGLEVIGFDYVEHGSILSSPDVTEGEQEEIIEETLHKFVERNEVDKDEVAISIAGHNSFSRFIKLPPVEKKRIPEIVQFEAVQQIPFDINEVEWDWQLMSQPDSPDAEVGIFALKNEVVSGLLSHFAREQLRVSCVQVGPMALYNYGYYDRKDISEESDKAVVILDMGTENTTLVVCSRDSVWQRSIRIGGNAFTEAIEEAFKLSFRKAEKLKKTAPMSKYMRQIYTAMKPVYTDLGGEIQRSLGFYTSSGQGRERGFSKIIALGGGMKLQGLAKYLQQTLNVPVIKPDSFERLKLAQGVSPAKFHENVSDFGIVYGLGAQLLDEPKIDVNLLPKKIARSMAWARKARYFTIAACILFAVALVSFAKVQYAKGQYNSKTNAANRKDYTAIQQSAQKASADLAEQQGRQEPNLKKVKDAMELFKYRQIVPLLNETLLGCFPNAENNPEQAALYTAAEKGDIDTVLSYSRSERKQLFLTRITIENAESIKDASFTNTGASRQRKATYMGEGMYDMGYPGDPSMMRGDPSMYQRRGEMTDPYMMGGPYGPEGMAGQAQTTEDDDDGVGFVVILEGYSPYGSKIKELMDPPGVGDNRDKWGLITRFQNLDKLFRGCQFELYKKDDIKHFSVEFKPVDPLDRDTPMGIGIEKEVERVPVEMLRPSIGGTARMDSYPEYGPGMGGTRIDRITREKVLIDPMTNEEISKTFDLITAEEVAADPDLTEKDIGKKKFNTFGGEPKFIERDYWFRIKAKFLWKDAPEPLKTPMMGGYDDYMMMGR